MNAPPVSPTPVSSATVPDSWWRRNRLWLAGAMVLGALAFGLPYREALQRYAHNQPQHPIDVAAGEWAQYEGARWRVLGADLVGNAGPGTKFALRADSAVLIVRYEVIADAQTLASHLDRCQGRLSDAGGRQWEANPLPLSRYRSALPRMCGSGYGPDFKKLEALPGRPFHFAHLFQLPRGQTLQGLRAELRMSSPKTVPDGTYLRFAL
ncbi:MAG TPA: hypothetical protein VGD42_13810 [Lysobacter sp.]